MSDWMDGVEWMIPHRLLQLLEHLRTAVQKNVIAKYLLTNHVCSINIIPLCNNEKEDINNTALLSSCLAPYTSPRVLPLSFLTSSITKAPYA